MKDFLCVFLPFIQYKNVIHYRRPLNTAMLSSIPEQAAYRKFNSRSVLPAPLLNKKEASFTLKAIGSSNPFALPPPPPTLTALLPIFSIPFSKTIR